MTGHMTGHYATISSMKVNIRTITVTEFKAKCLQIFDDLESDGIIVEKRGKPVAKVLPYHENDNSSLIGSMKGEIAVVEDIYSTGIKWNAES